MTKSEQTQLTAVIEQMKAEFAAVIKSELQPLADQVVLMHSAAVKATAWRKLAVERIKFLEKQVDTLIGQVAQLTPPAKPKFAALTNRCSGAEWNAAMEVLKLNHPGQTYFNREDVIATVERLVKPEPAHVEQAAPMVEVPDEEDVTL